MTYFPTAAVVEVDNYPYGKYRTKAYFGTEFAPKKGFRSTFQTLNPQTGRLNAVKKSTYYPFLIMCKDPDTGRVNHKALDFSSPEGLNTAAGLLKYPEVWQQLTKAEKAYIYATALLHCKVSLLAVIQYAGADMDKARAYFDPFADQLKKAFTQIQAGEDVNIWEGYHMNIDQYKNLKHPDPNWSPFRVASVSIIDGNGMREATAEERAEAGVS